MTTVNMVVGATTPDGATFVAKVDGGGPVRVAVADNESMTSPVFTTSQAVDAQGVVKVSISGLDTDTTYFWQVEDNSILSFPIGRFRTHPPLNLAASYILASASCAGANPDFPGTTGLELAPDRVSNAPVFDSIRNQEPLAFIHMGDLTYYDLGSGVVGTGTVSDYRRMYDDVLLQSRQHSLYREHAWIYGWDDHDFGPNDSDGTYVNKANAASVYRERVPHYTLDDANAIYQSWQIGRVLHILSDVRYDRSPNITPDGPAKTMLGAAQKAWFENLLSTTTAEALIWFMPDQWLAPGPDEWGSFATERDELVQILQDHGWLDRMVMVYGDKHAIGISSGATNDWGGFPIIEAAPMDSTPSGASPGRFDALEEVSGRGHYATIVVTDIGTTIGITLNAWDEDTLLGSFTKSITFPVAPTPTTDEEIARVVAGSHGAQFDVRVLETFQTGPDPQGTTVDFLDGSVQLDSQRVVRGTAIVRVHGQFGQDGKLAFPRAKSRLFAPFGNEIFIRYGIDFGDHIDWTPLGYYRITETSQGDAPVNPLSLQCHDRMATIADSELIDPRVYAPPQTVGDVFRDLVLDIYPSGVIEFDDATGDIPLGREVVAEKNRYKPLADLAESFGKIFFFNDDGILRIETPPDPATIKWEIRSKRSGTLVNAERQISREDIYNAVVVEGEGGDDKNPIRAVAIDNDPNSPTRFGGPLGQIPFFFTTPLVTTNLQAANAARILLQRQAIGAPFELRIDVIQNPRIRPYDSIRVQYTNNDRDVHIVDALTIELDVDQPMAIDTRERVVAIVQA